MRISVRIFKIINIFVKKLWENELTKNSHVSYPVGVSTRKILSFLNVHPPDLFSWKSATFGSIKSNGKRDMNPGGKRQTYFEHEFTCVRNENFARTEHL